MGPLYILDKYEPKWQHSRSENFLPSNRELLPYGLARCHCFPNILEGSATVNKNYRDNCDQLVALVGCSADKYHQLVAVISLKQAMSKMQ